MAPRSKRPKPNSRTGRDRELASSPWWSSTSGLSMVRDGVVLALVPIVLGLFPLISGHAEYGTRRGRLVLDGWTARAAGLAAIALGACLHFHFYWARHDSLSEHSQPAMGVASLVFLGATGFVVLSLLGFI